MSDREGELISGFTWYDKLAMRGGLAVVVGIGTFAIYGNNPVAAAAYLLFVALGGLVVMYYSLCVYCPYPYKHSDCLFFPYQLVASVTTMRPGSISLFKNALSGSAFFGIVAIPQYWLWGQWPQFAVFWVLVLVGGITIPRRFCRRCRHGRCPMRLVKLRTNDEDDKD